MAAIVANMGTSLRMIDDHYGHVLADMQSGILTGRDQVEMVDRPHLMVAAAAAAAAGTRTVVMSVGNPDGDIRQTGVVTLRDAQPEV